MKLITQLILSIVFVQGLSAQCIMVCDIDVEVSLNTNGEATIMAETFLEPSSDCIDISWVQVENSTGGVIYPAAEEIVLSCLDVGEYVANTIAIENGVVVNSCWTNFTVLEGAANCLIDIPAGNIPVNFEAEFTGPYVNQVYLNGNLIEKHNALTFSIDPTDIVAGENIITFDALSTSLNGISTLDLVLTRRIIDEIEIPGDTAIIAADIDNNLFVGIGDLVRSRNFILGIDPSGSSFFYTHVDQNDFGGLDPFDFGQNVYEYRFMDTDLPALELTFNPRQSGDVNSTFGFTSGIPSVDKALDAGLSFTDQLLEKGDVVKVDFNLSETSIEGLQLAIDLKGMKMLNVLSSYDANSLKTNEIGHQVRLSYFPSATSDDFAFTLELEAEKEGLLSDALSMNSFFSQELVNSSLGRKNIILVQNSPTATNDIDSYSFEMSPNPMVSSTQVHMSSEMTGEYTIEVRDVTGKTMFSDRSSDSIYSIDRSMMPHSGMYLLTVSQNGQVSTKKLMVR